MTTETCSTCGLPDELCVCEDMAQSEDSEVTARVEDAGFADKVMTILQSDGFTADRTDDLASELKSGLAVGGTHNPSEGRIELQGDVTNRDKLREILEDEYGYDLVVLS